MEEAVKKQKAEDELHGEKEVVASKQWEVTRTEFMEQEGINSANFYQHMKGKNNKIKDKVYEYDGFATYQELQFFAANDKLLYNNIKMSEKKAVNKNADISEVMQQEAVDCATQAVMDTEDKREDDGDALEAKRRNKLWHHHGDAS